MLHRSRTLISFVVAAGLIAGCKYFKPIDPNPKPKETKQTKPAAAPASAPATNTTGQAPAPSNRAPTTTAASATSQPRNVPKGSISDPNIAAMVLALNNTDISYARLALTGGRVQRDDVRQFANRMLTDHTGVNGLVTQLLTKLDVAPEDNQLSLDMRDESANKRDAMRDLTGYAFDSTYIENEVAYHQKFLSQIDNLMLRDARNADLRTLLTSVRPAVAAHLAHAEQVRADVLAKK